RASPAPRPSSACGRTRRREHGPVVVRVHVVAGERSDHLVRVHVRRRARAGLEDVDRELVVELAVGDARSRVRDPLRLVRVEQSELRVDERRGGLDATEPARDGRGDPLARFGGGFSITSRFTSPQLSMYSYPTL